MLFNVKLFVCVCLYVLVVVGVCLCVCMRIRENEREKNRDHFFVSLHLCICVSRIRLVGQVTSWSVRCSKVWLSVRELVAVRRVSGSVAMVAVARRRCA